MVPEEDAPSGGGGRQHLADRSHRFWRIAESLEEQWECHEVEECGNESGDSSVGFILTTIIPFLNLQNLNSRSQPYQVRSPQVRSLNNPSEED